MRKIPNLATGLLVFGLAAGVQAQGAVASTASLDISALLWTIPFVLLLLMIAILPMIPATAEWWERNRHKFLVSLMLGLLTCFYYTDRSQGFHGSAPGFSALSALIQDAICADYFPFIVLMFSLFTISGGVRLKGDIPARPLTNVIFLFAGAMMASFIGTTGASMLLIRPLLQINSERKHVMHTVIFFIFLVNNIGGALLPVGDPPLFLGYLRGVPFFWTLHLIPVWFFSIVALLGVYWQVDKFAYRRETPADLLLDDTQCLRLRVHGKVNLIFLAGVILAVAFLVPGKVFPGTHWIIPDLYLREMAQLGLAGLSLWFTSGKVRLANQFSFRPILEVAALFIGIFLTMQVPIEILQAQGSRLGLHNPAQFFWATGMLSSLLDNAPTYVVFFETAGSLASDGQPMLTGLKTASGMISVPLLLAISCGAVFMGAVTYIGNGPNFLVKSIAEHNGVRMPSFFGYMGISLVILVPLFGLVSLIFFI